MYVLRGFKAFIPSLEEFCEEHVASGPNGNAIEMQQSPQLHASGSVQRRLYIYQQQQQQQQQVLILPYPFPSRFIMIVAVAFLFCVQMSPQFYEQRALLHETLSNSSVGAQPRQLSQAEAVQLHRQLLHSHKALSFVVLCNLALWLTNSFQVQ